MAASSPSSQRQYTVSRMMRGGSAGFRTMIALPRSASPTISTARAIEIVGGADRGKAIIVLNPADPPLIMRDTVYCLCDEGEDAAIAASVGSMIAAVQAYVPGY